MSDVNAIKSYLDFAGLSNLRAKAKDDQTSSAKEVGRQFEAMFVQMMMKSIRQANESIKSDLMGSSAVDTFEEMYHNELSQVMANNDAFGVLSNFDFTSNFSITFLEIRVSSHRIRSDFFKISIAL